MHTFRCTISDSISQINTNQVRGRVQTQHNTTQHNTTQHNTTQHNTTQHNTTQHNTTQHNTTTQTLPQLICTDRHAHGLDSMPNWVRPRQLPELLHGVIVRHARDKEPNMQERCLELPISGDISLACPVEDIFNGSLNGFREKLPSLFVHACSRRVHCSAEGVHQKANHLVA